MVFEVPQGFPLPQYSFQANPVTKEGFELGRRLFYDGQLSKDGSISCASCHQQAAAFTTYDHDLSHGYNNSHTTRNAPGISNLAWYSAYNQDGSTKSLEAISLAHISSPIDMGESMDNVVFKVKNNKDYRKMFLAAFGDDGVNSQRILSSLSQFVINLVSYNSKYDLVIKGQASFTPEEQNGYALFKSNCNTCHTEPLFSDFSYRNIGLPLNPFIKDYGRMNVTNDKSDSLKFRVPSLRNVALTSTYTHDGRLGTLRNMINHYRTGVVQSPTLDPLLVNGIVLNDAQVDALIAFLKTLSDSSYLTNPRFAEQ
ncbi:MAG: cytochrome-c peroxidase [Chitinophagaceae bacterium]